MKIINYLVFFSFVLFIYSCDQEVECISCHHDLLEMVDDKECKCKEGYYQLGRLDPPGCIRNNHNANQKCIEYSENTYLVKSDADCYCSVWTRYDTIIAEFLLSIGLKPNISDPSLTPALSIGRLTYFSDTPEGWRFVIEGVNVPTPTGGGTEGACIRTVAYANIIGQFNQDKTYCEAQMIWYENTSDWTEGNSFDSCTLYFERKEL